MSVGAVNKQTGDRIPTAGMPAIDDALDLTSVNPVQNAIITAALANKQDKTDNSLQTTDKTVVGAVNELKSGLTNLDTEVNGDATVYPYADVITIEDAVPANLADCSVKIEPVQDLHGQSAPYVGGAGKNKLPLVLADIKAANTTGTWNGNVYTINGGTFTVYTDDGGNVTSIKVNGIFTNVSSLYFISSNYVVSSECKMNGCPYNGTYNSTYSLWAVYDDTYEAVDSGNGITLPVGTITQVRIRIAANYNAQNLLFYPMIRLSTETDATFAPYENICPISGHTQASVQRDGKNEFDDTLIVNPTSTAQWIQITLKPNTVYTVSSNIPYNSTSSYIFAIGGTDVSSATSAENGVGLDMARAVTTDNNGILSFGYRNNGASGVLDLTQYHYQIELGSTATSFEPYQGKTYTIALGSTIYGGTVDFDSGVMTVDRAVVDLGTLTWQKDSSVGHSRYVANNSGMKTSGSVISDVFQSTTYDQVYNNTKDNAIAIHNIYSQFAVHSTYYETDYDATQFGNAMSGHYACYELATPTTIQLTPQQIQLLKGTNTLTASTGQISVTANGVSGSIGAVQEQVNELAEDVATVESKQMVKTSETVTLNANGVSRLTLTFSNGRLIYAVVISTTATYLVLPYITSDKTWAVKVVDPTDMTPIASEEVEIGYGYIPN